MRGRQVDKFASLAKVSLHDGGWREARTAWNAPLTPAADTEWDTYPSLGDVFPWTSPGVTGNRRWPFGPSRHVLKDRWAALQSETDDRRRAELFKETRDRSLRKSPRPLPGVGVLSAQKPLALDRDVILKPVRLGYRSFDRQWVIPDARILDMPRPDLWAARNACQVFTIEQHSQPVDDGPGVVFSALIPDLHHFNGRGGRVLPLLNPDATPNVAAGLATVLGGALSCDVSSEDVLGYVAGVVAHPKFTRTFADELITPGIRVPFTGDHGVFREVVEIGKHVIWAHTYGESCSGPDRPLGNVRYPSGDARQPLAQAPITGMPTAVCYDEAHALVTLGGGAFGPVGSEVWAYQVGGKNVIKSWVNYRKLIPGGKKTSPLDSIHVTAWDPDWTTELIDLLTVLTRVVEFERAQGDLLDRVLTGPLLTYVDLLKAGVRWPRTAADRRPRYGAGARGHSMAPTLDL